MLSFQAGDIPVSASCLVSIIPKDLSGPGALDALAEELAEGAVHCSVDDLGSHHAVVVVRDQVVRDGRDGRSNAELLGISAQVMAGLGSETVLPDPAQMGEQELERLVAEAERTRSVDVFIPVPDQPRCMLLSFSTPLVPMFEPMTTLFVTLASTVQWQVGDDTWR